MIRVGWGDVREVWRQHGRRCHCRQRLKVFLRGLLDRLPAFCFRSACFLSTTFPGGFGGCRAAHVRAKRLLETAAIKTRDVAIPHCPQALTLRPISLNLPEDCHSAEGMPDRVHPRGFAALVIRVNGGDELIDILQSQSMPRRGQDSLADDCSIGKIWFDG